MSKIKKATVILGAGLFSLVVLCSPVLGQGIKLGFKVTGGMNYQMLGDANKNVEAMKTRTDDYVAAYSGFYTLEKSALPFLSHFGYEFEAEAIVYISPQFGIGIGAGYVRGGTIFGSGHQTLSDPGGQSTDFLDVAATAVPIKVSAYYTFSSAFATQGKSTTYLFGGLGLYSAKFSYTENWEYLSSYEDYFFEAKSSGLGFHVGLGGEGWVNPNFAFVYELQFRYAKIGGFTGNWTIDDNGWTDSGSGTLYAYEWLDSGIGNWYPGMWVMDPAPSGPETRNVQEAKIDFTAITFKIGIKVNI